MKKRLVAYGALSIVICAVLCYSCFSPGVSLVNYLRVRDGMTMSEVGQLLSKEQEPTWRHGEPIFFPNQGCAEYWHGYAGGITVVYDTEGRVIYKQWTWDRNKREAMKELFTEIWAKIRR